MGELPWGKAPGADPLDTKYMYVCHAEMNAIMNKISANVEGCSMYVALFPCNECTKIILQSGIKEVVYCSDKHAGKPEMIASRHMLNIAGVSVRQFVPSQNVKDGKIVIDLNL